MAESPSDNISSLPVSTEKKTAEHPPFIGLVTGERVNLRVGPSPSAEILSQLKKGTKVQVLEKKGAWFAVPLPPEAAVYVARSFLKMPDEGTGPAQVRGARVHLRCGPGQAYASCGILRDGQGVQVRKISGEWAQVDPPASCRGWVSELYLTYLYPVDDQNSESSHGNN